MSTNLVRAAHLTIWLALLALLLGLLGYALFFGFAFIVLSPLILLGAIIGGAIGHGIPSGANVVGPMLAYLALCLLLVLLAGAVSFRVWRLFTAQAGSPPTSSKDRPRGVRNLGAVASASSYLPRGWIATSAIAGMVIGLAAWFPLADPVVGTFAPVEWLHPRPDPTLVPQPTTEAAVRELDENIRPRAVRGDPYAQWQLGEALRNGLMGLTPDPQSAGEWIAKSAAQGDPDGQLSLITGAIAWDLPDARDNSLPPRMGQLPRLEEYAARNPGWRRVAAELMFAGATNDRIVWFERAARHGSRFAAFALARELEDKRDEQNRTVPDLDGAYAWYSFADAEFEMARLAAKFDAAGLARAQDRSAAVAEQVADGLRAAVLAPHPADDVARFARRAQIVGVRATVTGANDMRAQDASAHAIVYAEASGDFAALANYYGGSADERSSPRDRPLGMWLHSLGARNGDVVAMIESARLLEHSQGRVPKHLEQMYAWYALAAERLQAASSDDEALVATAIDGRGRAATGLDAGGLRDAEALLAALRPVVPSR